MIIVEGADLIGKTTLAKELEKRTGMVYQHLSRLPDTFVRGGGYIHLSFVNSVRDRFHLSELAYCDARKERRTMSNEFAYFLNIELKSRFCAFNIVLTASEDLIRKRYVRDEMYDIETVLRANKSFEELAESELCDCHLHFSEGDEYPTDDEIRLVLDEYQNRRSMWAAVRDTISSSTR